MTVAGFAQAAPGASAGVAGDGGELPIRDVHFADAEAACQALGKRLPTEAEWELAATRSRLDPAGARLRRKGIEAPAAVGSHPGDCTADGVCDLLGNVSEWTSDRWRRGGALDPDDDVRTVRGASFRVAPSAAWYGSVQARARVPRSDADPEVGFRCAKDATAR
jgi:serine/threonine-protein kinase